MAAVTFRFFSSIGAAITIGTVLLISGLATIITLFWTGNWSAFLLQLLIGILYTVMGLAITDAPAVSVMALTMMVATFAIVAGVFRVTTALMLRCPPLGWTVLNGVVPAVFGVMIFRHVPEASLWLIGTLIGLELIRNGITWIMLSLELRTLSADERTTSAQSE